MLAVGLLCNSEAWFYSRRDHLKRRIKGTTVSKVLRIGATELFDK